MSELQFNIQIVGSELIPLMIELNEEEYEMFSLVNNDLVTVEDNIVKIVNTFFSRNSIVKDEVRYEITVDGNGNCTKEKIAKESIVLILESPHISEYLCDQNILVPVGPAQGTSPGEAGGAIEKYIEVVLNKIDIPEGIYQFIIVNPIQFQTSLAHTHGTPIEKVSTLRDKVWQKIWEQEAIREDFNRRLTGYNPAIIINSCTKNLKLFINEDLINIGYENIVYTAPHPTYWNFKKGNIEIKKLTDNNYENL